MTGCIIEKMLAVGKEGRPAVRGVFRRVKLRGALRGSAGSADSPERVAVVRFVKNHVVLAPRPAARIGSICKDRCGAAGGNFLQFAIGEESDKRTVGGPERFAGFFCALELSGGAAVQGLHPDGIG